MLIYISKSANNNWPQKTLADKQKILANKHKTLTFEIKISSIIKIPLAGIITQQALIIIPLAGKIKLKPGK